MAILVMALPSYITISLLFFFLLIQIHGTFGCYTSLFSFGDSFSDTGNGIHCNHDDLPYQYPYGATYFHKPTGRCSNGRLIIDFIAQALGLPFLPPYLGDSKQDLSHGVNFAVAGASAINASFFAENNISLSANCSLQVQLDWFRQHLHSMCRSASECKSILKNALFIVGTIGANDYNHPLFEGMGVEWVYNLVPKVIDIISSTIMGLIEEGVTTLMVPGSIPSGCSVAFIATLQKSGKDDIGNSTGCLKWLNDFCQFHNDLLQNEINRLREIYPHAKIIYADFYKATMELYQFSDELGFSKGGLKACCGGGGPYNYDLSLKCGAKGCIVCDDPSLYISWDGAHLTEPAYKWIAHRILEGSFSIPRFNTSCISSQLYNVDSPSYL